MYILCIYYVYMYRYRFYIFPLGLGDCLFLGRKTEATTTTISTASLAGVNLRFERCWTWKMKGRGTGPLQDICHELIFLFLFAIFLDSLCKLLGHRLNMCEDVFCSRWLAVFAPQPWATDGFAVALCAMR